MSVYIKEMSIYDQVEILGHVFGGVEDIEDSVGIHCRIAENWGGCHDIWRSDPARPVPGIYVARLYDRYPCFDSYDYASETRNYCNYFFSETPFSDSDLERLSGMSHKGNSRLVHEGMAEEAVPAVYRDGDHKTMTVATRGDDWETSMSPEECHASGENLLKEGKYVEALQWFEKAADCSYAPAMYNAANIYRRGLGVAQNYPRARELYQRSSDLGYALSQTNLGVMYNNGEGMPKNPEMAMYWYHQAASQGERSACHNLGMIYLGKNDFASGVKYLKEAASLGLADSQCAIGLMYLYGSGVSTNLQEASRWLVAAAEQGLANAQYYVGLLYQEGAGVSKDYSKAAEWYRKAADQGYKEALCNLGVLYSNGQGVDRDMAKATYMWICAAKLGDQLSVKFLKDLHIRVE